MLERRELASPRGRVCYWRELDAELAGPTLVFLHGLTADHTLFDKQVEYFGGHYPLLVWDAPAHGLSRPYTDFSYVHAAFDLAALLDAEGVERAVLLGQSMGGFVAQSFLARWPQRVAGFVAVDTCPYGQGYYSRADRFWLRRVEPLARLYPARLLRRALAANATCTAAARRSFAACLRQYTKDELCRLMGLGFGGFLDDNQDMSVDCPTLILYGEHDKTGKVRQYCRQWRDATGFETEVIRDAAHNANVDNPAQVNIAIERFVRGLRPR